jgi:formamidopyrimidine-DNA glycosylase
MPELPEVETVRKDLLQVIQPKARIQSIVLHRSDIRFPIPKDLIARLTGHSFSTIHRRAKYLLFQAQDEVMISHLGMSGGWMIKSPDFVASVHDHCEIQFSDGVVLVYRDPRRFGVLDVVKSIKLQQHKLFKHLGPEPLNVQEFTPDYLFEKSRGRTQALKTFIMDQRIVVGVGNIYASEVLFLSGLSPKRAAGRLTRTACVRLVQNLQDVLAKAILAGGSTIRDYRSLRGQQGEFQGQHLVYDREGKPCTICRTPIKNAVLGARSTYWCPQCQRA